MQQHDSSSGPAILTEEEKTMCGRFAQYQSRDFYLDSLGVADTDYVHDPEPIGRYNVAPGTRVLLLSQRGGELKLAPGYWG